MALETCVVTGYIYDYTNTPQSAVEVVFKVPSRMPQNPQSDQNIFLKQTIVSVYTDTDGKFTITLPREVYAHITCSTISLDHDFVVPDKASEDLDNILPFYRRENYRKEDGQLRAYGDFFSEGSGGL